MLLLDLSFLKSGATFESPIPERPCIFSFNEENEEQKGHFTKCVIPMHNWCCYYLRLQNLQVSLSIGTLVLKLDVKLEYSKECQGVKDIACVTPLCCHEDPMI